jgi:hypothetical protein
VNATLTSITIHIGKKLVVSVHCGNPDLVILQKKSLDAFMMEAYEYIVYDDSMATPDVSNYFTSNMQKK